MIVQADGGGNDVDGHDDDDLRKQLYRTFRFVDQLVHRPDCGVVFVERSIGAAGFASAWILNHVGLESVASLSVRNTFLPTLISQKFCRANVEKL